MGEPLRDNLGAKSAISKGCLLKQEIKSSLLILPSIFMSNKLKSPWICIQSNKQVWAWVQPHEKQENRIMNDTNVVVICNTENTVLQLFVLGLSDVRKEYTSAFLWFYWLQLNKRG